MNDRKLNQLFKAAARESAPVPPTNFEPNVMIAIRREPASGNVSLFDQLNAMFPRLAFAAVLTIAVFVAGDFLLTVLHTPSLTDGMSQITAQWFLTSGEF